MDCLSARKCKTISVHNWYHVCICFVALVIAYSLMGLVFLLTPTSSLHAFSFFSVPALIIIKNILLNKSGCVEVRIFHSDNSDFRVRFGDMHLFLVRHLQQRCFLSISTCARRTPCRLQALAARSLQERRQLWIPARVRHDKNAWMLLLFTIW